MAACIAENIGDNFHRGFRWVDIGIAHHELLENIILDGPAQLFRRHTLFLSCHDIKRHDWQNRSVHGHRYRNVAERNLIEKNFHVFDRIYSYTRFPDVANHTLMIRIVTTVSRKIKCDREPFLAGGKILAVKAV